MARAAQIAAAEQIGDTVLQRRQHRSFIEDDSPPTTAPRGLLLSSHAIDVCAAGRGKDPRVHRLLVMKKDGTKRGARDIYEWLQQFCVEQCAALPAWPCGWLRGAAAVHGVRALVDWPRLER